MKVGFVALAQREIVAALEAERKVVDANWELITKMERRIQAKLAEIWGEEISGGTQET